MKVFEYYKSTLDKNLVKLYELFVKEFKLGCLTLSFEGYSFNDITKVYTAVFLDHPEIYYLSIDCLIEQEEVEYNTGLTKLNNVVTIKDLYPKDIKDEIIKRFNLAYKRIKSILPENPNNVEIEVAILKYINRICIPENNDELNQNAASCLAFGKAQCTGYAKAFSLLMNKFNIPTFIATGEAYDYNTCTYIPHAWNIVNLNGKFYHVDPSYALDFRIINRTLNLEYFNIPDKEIKKTHRWEHKFPECIDKSFLDIKIKEPINNKPINRIVY